MGLGLCLRAFRQFLRMAELLDGRGSPEAAGLSEERRHPLLDCLVCFPVAVIRQPDKAAEVRGVLSSSQFRSAIPLGREVTVAGST